MLLLAWRGVRFNLGRYLATLLAIVTGVGFFAATGFIGQRIVDSVEGDIRRQFDDVDVAVTAEETGDDSVRFTDELRLPASVVDRIATLDGVEATAGVLTGIVALETGAPEPERLTGRLWIADQALNPIEIQDGRSPRTAGEVAVDRGVAADHDIEVGDEVEVVSIDGVNTATVVGVTRFGDADALDLAGTVSIPAPVAFDWLSAGTEEYREVHVRSAVPQAELVAAIEPLVPAGFTASTGSDYLNDKIDEVGSQAQILRQGLQGFAVLALVVGAFVIYNTFTVIAAQRTRELAVLSAIGATPRQLRRSLLLEGLVVGAVGSALGVVTGVGFALLIDLVLTRFLDVDLPGGGLTANPTVAAQALLAGVVVTVASVLAPARRAARTEPIGAMRDAVVERAPYTGRRLATSLVLAIAGLALIFVGRSPVQIGAGFFALFVATIAAGPIFAVGAARLTRPLATRLGLEGRLASDNSARNPQRTATTANALLIGVFLVTLVSVAGTSLRDFVVDEIEEIATADYLIASNGGSLDDQLIAAIAQTDGVERVEPFRRESVALDDAPSLVSTADLDALLDITGIDLEAGSFDDLVPGAIVVSGATGYTPGDSVTLATSLGSRVELTVVATTAYSTDMDQIGSLIHRDDFDRLAGASAPTVAFIDVAPGVKSGTEAALREQTRARPDLQLTDGNFLGKLLGDLLDFVINAVNGLLGMSVTVAVIGIINTLSLSVLERRRELGLLRIVGMVDKKVQRMIRIESVLISLLGTLVGVALGLFTGWALVRAITRLTDTDIAVNLVWIRLVAVVAVGLVLGIMASLVPARRSTRLDALDAIQAT